jgi:hypothetical protein
MTIPTLVDTKKTGKPLAPNSSQETYVFLSAGSHSLRVSPGSLDNYNPTTDGFFRLEVFTESGTRCASDEGNWPPGSVKFVLPQSMNLKIKVRRESCQSSSSIHYEVQDWKEYDRLGL